MEKDVQHVPADLWAYCDPSLHVLHSVRLESDFKDVFHALHNAIDLRSQIIDDVWQCQPLQSSSSTITRSILSTCDPLWRPLIRPAIRHKAEPPPSPVGLGEVHGRRLRSQVSFQERVQVHLWDHHSDCSPTIEVQSFNLHDLLQNPKFLALSLEHEPHTDPRPFTWRVAAFPCYWQDSIPYTM